jgi:hypothetical protein
VLHNDPRPRRVVNTRQQGVRKVFTRSKRTICGYSPSRKVGQRIPFEASLEEAFICHLEVDPNVLNFTSQPRKLDLWIDGHVRHHFPDFLVETKEFASYCEVKPSKYAALDQYQACFRASAAYLRDQNYQYRVFTEEWIGREPALTNARRPRRYAADAVDPSHEWEVMARLRAGRARLIDLAGSDSILRETVFALCVKGILSFDKETEEVNPETRFYPAEQETLPSSWGRRFR